MIGKRWQSCWALMLLWSIAAPVCAEVLPGDEVDQLIVSYHESALRGQSPVNIADMAARSASTSTGLSIAYKRPMARVTGAHVLKLPYAMTVSEARLYARQIMAANPEIEYVEPDYRRYPLRTVPDDTRFNQQWHLLAPEDYAGAMNAVNAWDITKGSTDIVLAVLDEGITDHRDLQPNLVGGSAAQSGYDMVADTELAADGDGRDADPSNPGVAPEGNRDSAWHGTHVGGIMAARPDNGEFVAGVGWNSRLLAVRILSDAGGLLSDQVDGMLWAGGETVPGIPDNVNPAQILNLSVGTDFFLDCARTEQNAINILRARGVSVVVASGNENRNVKGSAPANCEGVIAVTGVMPDGARASYANFGMLNDIAAPADEIYSTFNSGSRAPEADTVKADSGTSQAAPQVAGVLALMLAANDKLRDEQVVAKADLPGLLEDKLKQSARAFPADIDGADDPRGCNNNQQIACACDTDNCGAGLLDAQRAVQAVATAPEAVTGEDRVIEADVLVTLDGSASSDDEFGGKVVAYRWEQLEGSTVPLESSDQAQARFTAPAVARSDQALRFKLTVTDDVGLQDSAEVVLTVPGRGGGGSMPILGLLAVFLLLLTQRLRVSACISASRPEKYPRLSEN